MNIVLNGERKTLPSSMTVHQLLEMHNIVPETIVVEVNEVILQGKLFADTHLSENDRVEIIRFVGGG